MKLFILLSCYLVSVSSNALLDLKGKSSTVKQIVRECITGYKIDPAVIDISLDNNKDLYEKLNGKEQGCVSACVYKGFDWLNDDGTLDIETLTDGDTPDEAAKLVKSITDCRASVGKDDCEFFHCLNKKDA